MLHGDTPYVLSREQYEHLVSLCLTNMNCPDELIPAIIRRGYPQTAEATLAELSWRGFEVSIGEVLAFASNPDNEVRNFCGIPAFAEHDVDKLARFLLSRYRLNDVAKARKRAGITAEVSLNESVGKLSTELQRRAVDACRN